MNATARRLGERLRVASRSPLRLAALTFAGAALATAPFLDGSPREFRGPIALLQLLGGISLVLIVAAWGWFWADVPPRRSLSERGVRPQDEGDRRLFSGATGEGAGRVSSPTVKNWKRWLPWSLAAAFGVLWLSAVQTDDSGAQVAPDLIVPFFVLALGCLLWGVWSRRNRSSAGPARGGDQQ